MDPETVNLLREGFLLWIILCISIALHEYGHAKSADMLGDGLPASQGRVTLNPLAHLDPIGTGVIPLFNIFGPLMFGGSSFFMIGWGRPVQVNPSAHAPHLRMRNDLIVTACGPLMNLLIAFTVAIVGGLATGFSPDIQPLVLDFIYINCALVAFNMLPIPPLDGSHFMRYLTRMSEETYYTLAGYSLILMIVLINLPPFRMLLGVIINIVATPFLYLYIFFANLAT